MSEPQTPASEGSDSSLQGGESIVERAMRRSFEERSKREASKPFSQDDHRAIAESGAADLSNKEKFGMFEDVHHHTASKPADTSKARESRPIPLFFGSWSGMNPFRFMKPFFLQKKKDNR